MSFPCPTKVTCPCSDDPMANLSAEGYDQRSYLGYVWPKLWRAQCCEYVCESTISQADADLCAHNIAVQADAGLCSPQLQADGTVRCATSEDPPPPTIFWNTEQCCTATCLDGLEYTHCIPAHTVSGESQNEADSIAYSMACDAADTEKFCMSPVSMGCCLNKLYSQQLIITGGTGPFTWTITSGTLPAGLFLSDLSGDGRVFEIAGIPTVAGISPVGIQVEDANGHMLSGTLAVGVQSILPASLAAVNIGSPYSQQLTMAGVQVGTSVTYSIVSGALPGGLSMDANGLISGTPTGTGIPATFEVEINTTP